MNILSIIYTEVFYRPFLNGLVWLYASLPGQDLGLAIVLFVLAIRLILTPLLLKGQNAQKKMAILQPEMRKIQEQFKNDKEKQGKALMELYAKHKANPFSGCLPLLVQLPVLFALLGIFRGVLDPANLSYLYSFIPHPDAISPITLGTFDLSRTHSLGNLLLGLTAGASQFVLGKYTMPPPQPDAGDFAKSMHMQTLYIIPVVLVASAWFWPAAIMLYWTLWNIFGILQEIIVKRGFIDMGNKK